MRTLPLSFPWRSGMTLIELLIVLGLMAAIATVALTTLDDMGDRTRMDTTHSRLDMIEEAIVGNGLEPGRFLSDMGRLPVLHGQIPDPDNPTDTVNTESGEGLIELWYSLDVYGSLPPIEYFNGFETGVSVGLYDGDMCSSGTVPVDPMGMAALFPDTGFSPPDPEDAVIVDVPGGWRGPYLRLAGQRLFDGFGNPLRFTQDHPAYPPYRTDLSIVWDTLGTSSALVDLREITGVASYGRDNTEDSTLLPDEPKWASVDESRLLDGGRSRATLSVSVKASSAAGWQSPVFTEIPEYLSSDDYTFPDVVADTASPPQVYLCAGPVAGGTAGTDPSTDTRHDWRRVDRHHSMNRLRVMLFAPFADPDYTNADPVRARIVTVWSDNDLTQDPPVEATGCGDTESSSSSGAYCLEPIEDGLASQADRDSRRVIFDSTAADTVEIANLPPGIRKLYVYGYYTPDNTTIMNSRSSGLQTIELTPGVNHVTVYLTQPLQ